MHEGLSAVHLITHGFAGGVQIGASHLNGASLKEHASQIAAWGEALADSGDIVLYGCNVALGRAGEARPASNAAAQAAPP